MRTATIQAFLNEARFLDSKPQEAHDMTQWKCGTASCAVGDMATIGELGLKIVNNPGTYDEGMSLHHNCIDGALYWEDLGQIFGISSQECEFLFGSVFFLVTCTKFRNQELPSQTAARIRKYVYYKLHKKAILADYEKARRTGDIGVVQGVCKLVG
jgi:hypothetical protein